LHKANRIPPEQVWQRIEDQQTAQKGKFKIWRFAALIAIGICSAIFGYRFLNSVQQNAQIVSFPEMSVQEEKVHQLQVDPKIEGQQEKLIVHHKPKVIPNNSVEKSADAAQGVIISDDSPVEVPVASASFSTESEAVQEIQTISDLEQDQMVIVYALPVTENQNVKTSRATAFDRMLNYARDLKSGDAALVDLRGFRKIGEAFTMKRKKANSKIIF
jgi:hypothetical protein